MSEKMNEEKKLMRKLKIFFPWEEEKHQAWLTAQSKAGWELVKMGLFYWFEKRDDGPYRYEIDFFESGKKDKETYLAVFEEAGWEHVCSSQNWHYFRILESEYTTSIYSDAQSKIEMFQRYNYSSAFVLVMFILFVDFDWMGQDGALILANVVVDVLLTALLIGNAIVSVAVYQRIKELKQKSEELIEN